MSAGVSPTTQEDRPPWPYPRWIAHRGAGKLAPENTLAAFRLGAQHGFRMFECDVKLSADGVPFLMHDATLARTTRAPAALNAGGVAGAHPWSRGGDGTNSNPAGAGRRQPAGQRGGERGIGRGLGPWRLAQQHALNIEIKPTPGMEERTGQVVAAHAERLWKGAAIAPLLTSFQPDALRAAQNEAPALPRGLLLDTLWSGWLETALTLDCIAVVCNQDLWDGSSVTQARSAGLRLLAYIVNDEWAALGIDGITTDRVDLFAPAAG